MIKYYLKLIFVDLPKLALSLSGSFFASGLLYLKFVSFLIAKKIFKSINPWKFEFIYKKKGFSLKLFEGSTDIAALKEIFVDGEYFWDKITNPKVIIDLGAHTGNTAIFFHLKYPEAKIYALEASPKNFEHLKKNVENVPHIKPIFGAISDLDGEITFYESESSLGSSVQKRGENDRPVDVPSYTLATLLKNENIEKADLIKIDIEGAEERLFTDMSPEDLSESYMIEVHNDLMMTPQEDFIKKFNAFTLDSQNTAHDKRILLKAIRKT